MHRFIAFLITYLMFAIGNVSASSADYQLGPGDTIRIQVFQSPDLTLETRIAESGTISYPLIGSVRIGSLSLDEAGQQIAKQLKDGGFVQQPQVTVVLLQNRANQVSVLGQVNRPGRYPLESTATRLTEMIATAGGVSQNGDDRVVVTGTRNSQPFRKEVDLPSLFLSPNITDDIILQGGDAIYVHRAPVFYIYGEAQRPGAYRIERGMTVRQAIAQGGGPTARGTEKDPRIERRKADGSIETITPALGDLVRPEDVIRIRESLF